MHTHSAAAEQRRMIYTEDKAKVVAAVLGDVPGWYEEKDELRQVDMKRRMSSSYSSNRPGGKQPARQGIE